jgi:hypothetical protein
MAWRNWRVKRLGRRTDRWKEEMREKEVVLLKARQERLTSSAFKVRFIHSLLCAYEVAIEAAFGLRVLELALRYRST